MNLEIVNTLIREGGGILMHLISLARSPKVEHTELESPEEAFQRLYGKKTTTEQKLKLKAAEKAIEAVDQELKKEVEKEEIAEGTACVPCAADHFSVCAGILSDEAIRMSRRKGIADKEVIERVMHCSDQLNAMEREDLAIDKIARLPKWEKDIAIYAQNKGAEIRHKLNDIESVEDLETIGVELKHARDKIGSEYIRGRLSERH